MRRHPQSPAQPSAATAALLQRVPALGALRRQLPAAEAARFMAHVADVAAMPRCTTVQREWQAMTAESLVITWGALGEPAQGVA